MAMVDQIESNAHQELTHRMQRNEAHTQTLTENRRKRSPSTASHVAGIETTTPDEMLYDEPMKSTGNGGNGGNGGSGGSGGNGPATQRLVLPSSPHVRRVAPLPKKHTQGRLLRNIQSPPQPRPKSDHRLRLLTDPSALVVLPHAQKDGMGGTGGTIHSMHSQLQPQVQPSHVSPPSRSTQSNWWDNKNMKLFHSPALESPSTRLHDTRKSSTALCSPSAARKRKQVPPMHNPPTNFSKPFAKERTPSRSKIINNTQALRNQVPMW
jgi:hypothetical protein